MKKLVQLVIKMWTLLFMLSLAIPRIESQSTKIRRPFDNGHGFDVRLAVPGHPGNDYPTLDNIPKTSFTCSGKEPGYYADTETNCQVFRVCTFGSTYGFQSFLCPNGTLFNQAVFVCDWWMNVKCEKSKELYNFKNDSGNLKIGPHFMRDIRKMITHPMRNPYDKTYEKNNLIIMQEYKPPNGQLYNSISEKFSHQYSNKYSQLQTTSKNSFQELYSTNNISFAATTSRTQYSSNLNTYPPSNKNVDFFQQQGSKSFPQANIINNPRKLQTEFYNAHTGRKSPTTVKNILNYNKNLQLLRPTQIYQKGLQNLPYINSLNSQDTIQRDQLLNKKQSNKAEQIKLGTDYSKQQLNQHIAQDKELYSSKSNQVRFLKDTSNQVESKTKNKLVSNDTSTTLIRKTLAFHRVIKDSKNGSPKSRITFKTWILRPRNGKLLADTTPYTYNNPLKYGIENYNPNTLSYPNENSKAPLTQVNSSYEPYEYNPPTTPSTQIITYTTSTPTTFVTSSSSLSPTKASLLYLPPTTYMPLPIIYGPPTENIELSRQYLLPNELNSPLTAAGSSPVPYFQSPLTPNSKDHSFSSNEPFLSKTDNKKIAFSDILTKENLDITVSDIVKDTNNILKTASPNDVFDFRQDIETIDYPEINYLPQNIDNQSGEKVLSDPPPILAKNSRLIATPSVELEPPVESFEYSNNNANALSYLSFIKKPVLPTIERTVSFKITIPEKIADYIFKKSSKNISDNLEILNTGNTNHFVLANKNLNTKESQYVPVGKITWNNSSDISPSQDLVLSFLADSINAAKKYSNTVTQNTVLPTSSQLRNLNSDDLGSISNKISQLTSAQYKKSVSSGNGNIKNDITKNQQLKGTRQSVKANQQSTYRQSSNPTAYLQTNSDQIYSGQLYKLPVPEVAKLYNLPNQANAKYKLSKNELANNIQHEKKKQETIPKFDIIESQTLLQDSFQPPSNHQERIDQGSTFLDNIYLPKDSITAQIHDNTVGTIPHPLNGDKVIKYKKNQIYYIYTQLSKSNNTGDKQNNDNLLSQQNRQQSDHVSFQIIPSVGYKLEDNTENQNLLRTFQIGQVGNPKRFIPNTYSNQRLDVASDVDYIVNHPSSRNGLYNGPSSYSAPQASVGSLEFNQNSQTNFNANLEKFDTTESYGYPKVKPSKRFLF